MKYKYLIFLFLLFLPAIVLADTENNSSQVLILYDSRYGSTELISYWIGKGIDEKMQVLNVNDASDVDFSKYDFILLGSPIYKAEITDGMKKFLAINRDKFQNKPIGLFVVCGMHLIHGERWLDGFEKETGVTSVIRKAFGGRLVPDKLNEPDRQRLINYWADRGVKEIKGFDYLSEEESRKFAEEINMIISHKTKQTSIETKTQVNIESPEKLSVQNARNECYDFTKDISPNTLNMAEYERLTAEKTLQNGNIEEAKSHFNLAKGLYYKAKEETLIYKNKQQSNLYDQSLIPLH